MIEAINNQTYIITVADLGIELKPSERIDIENIDDKHILSSINLKDSTLTYEKDGSEISYDRLIQYITKLNSYKHRREETLAHNIRESYFFNTEKENGSTKKIVYYSDVAKTKKIREEEIIRQGGLVGQIISRVFDDDGLIIEEEVQTLNRGASGSVESITAIIQE